ncbi:MAG: hypothetical protein AB7U41_02785, partial [Dongiaceae bacterium]
MELAIALGVIALIVVILMVAGQEFFPGSLGGGMMRSPSMGGDMCVAAFLLIFLLGIAYLAVYGFKKPPFWDRMMAPSAALMIPIASQNITHIAFITPEGLAEPAALKRKARKFCEELNQPACVVNLWKDNNYMPRQFPVTPVQAAAMSATYRLTTAKKE